jgi:hypothetical protein
MDGYLMTVPDALVNAAAGHKVISFMYGNVGYNQILMGIKDVAKLHLGALTTSDCMSGLS